MSPGVEFGCGWRASVFLEDQGGEHSLDRRNTIEQGRDLANRDQCEIARQEQVRFQLSRRSLRDVKESFLVAVAMAPTAFRNVRGNRRGRTPQLRREPELLLRWHLSSAPVHVQRERVGKLPYPQVLEVADESVLMQTGA